MEHLPQPLDPAIPLPKVKCLCAPEYYDGGAFLDYPRRQGWINAIPSVDDPLSFYRSELSNPSPTRDLEGLLQSWLFFGLLNHILSPFDLYCGEDYVRRAENDSDVYLTTSRLTSRLRAWLGFIGAWEQDARDSLYHEIYECVSTAACAAYVLSLQSHSTFDRDLRRALLALLELLFNIADRDNAKLNLVTGIGYNPAEVGEMCARGWCRSEVSMVQTDFSSLADLFYFQRLRRPEPLLDHRKCTDTTCIHDLSQSKYSMRHVLGTCSCEVVGPDPEEVFACISTNAIPVLRLKNLGASGIALEVVPYHPDLTYIAVSHVCADGLWNPSDMRLYRCQIERLFGMLDSLRGRSFHRIGPNEEDIHTVVQGEVYFWLDTLCCPTETMAAASPRITDLRATTIASLRQIYRDATCVLTVDRGLEATVSQPLSSTEKIARILTSRWMRRMWTFQEGGVATILLISFADEIVNYRDIWSDIRDSYNDAIRISVFTSLLLHCANLRVWFHRSTVADSAELVKTGTALWNLGHRRVSVASDEPLCLAALFNLDSGLIARTEPGLRMQTFWRILSESSRGIPASLIFNNAPRLSEAGFRWAPRTVQTPPTTKIRVNLGDATDDTGKVTDIGLLVRRRGWRIRRVDAPAAAINRASFLVDETAASHIVNVQLKRDHWMVLGEWSSFPEGGPRLVPLPLADIIRDGTKDWYVILGASSDPGTGHKGLLAWSETLLDGRIKFHSAAVVWVTRMNPGVETKTCAGDAYGSLLRRWWSVRFMGVLERYEATARMMLAWIAWNRAQARAYLALRLIKYWWIVLEARLHTHLTNLLKAGNDEANSVPRGTQFHAAQILAGRYAIVQQEYDADTVWHVD